MDRVIYIAMTGAREVTRQQAAMSHNLANISTHGFKQELNVFRALPVVGEGARTRAFVLETTPRSDFTQGAIQQTGRDRHGDAFQRAGGVVQQDRLGHDGRRNGAE